jgi:hypothetical protein
LTPSGVNSFILMVILFMYKKKPVKEVVILTNHT